MAKPIRIQKVLSDGGVLSLRKAEEYVRAGRITVNGHKAVLGNPIFPTDVIAIDGVRVVLAKKKENRYLMLNKPRGYVTTTSDELGRRCITELIQDVDARVYPVGRLDKDSEGLLLLTNDGQFANLVMHPSHHVNKTYRVTVRPGITEEQCITLSTGVDIGEGERSGPAAVLVQEKYPDRVVVQITISEGKNREVRRMCEGVGLEVARLKRISVGPLRLGMLQPGKWRELKKSEVIALKNAAKPAGQQEPMPRDQGGSSKVGSFGSGERREARHTPAPTRPGKDGDGIRRDKHGAFRFDQGEEKPRKGGYGPKPEYKKSEPRSDFKSGPKPEYKSGPRSDFKSGPKPEYKSGPRSDFKSGPKPEYKSGPKPEYKSGPRSDFKSGPKPEYKSGPRSDFKSGPKPEYKSGPRSDFKSGPKPEYKSGPRSDFKSGPKPEYKSGPRSDFKSGPKQRDQKPGAGKYKQKG